MFLLIWLPLPGLTSMVLSSWPGREGSGGGLRGSPPIFWCPQHPPLQWAVSKTLCRQEPLPSQRLLISSSSPPASQWAHWCCCPAPPSKELGRIPFMLDFYWCVFLDLCLCFPLNVDVSGLCLCSDRCDFTCLQQRPWGLQRFLSLGV